MSNFNSYKVSKHVLLNELKDQSNTDQEKIPLYVWNNRNESQHHLACLQQNGGQFGYISLNNLKFYTGPPVHWKAISDILQAHKIVRSSGAPNCLYARIPVVTPLKDDNIIYIIIGTNSSLT